MDTISRLFDALYSHFLLRDIVAKVIPGLLTMTTFVPIIADDFSVLDNPFFFSNLILTVIVMYGVGFAVGQLLQYIGMWKDMTITHVWMDDNGQQHEKKSVAKAVEFLQLVPSDHSLARKRERMIVLKEMQGNFAISLAIFGVIQATNALMFADLLPRLLFTAGALLISFILRRHNHALAREQRHWEREAIDNFA